MELDEPLGKNDGAVAGTRYWALPARGPAGPLRGLGAKLLQVWEGELMCWVGCYKWGGRVQF